ncbi:uncharacterized protein [Medicago truncatula]|uniref:uncharacterized protein isoform X1 n=1 Tax=Medicago truncatula TaxID=3880 RepID=UPI000D2F221C|nr:uncharacterized protein LOC11415598 isoform X1 [Medicago truncatula]
MRKKVGNIDDTVEFYFNLIFFSVGGVFSLFGFYVISIALARRCHTSAKWLWNKVFPSSQHGVARLTNNAAQQERHERCFCFSKSKYSKSPKLKGLKGIAEETYIQETDTDFRQEVKQHQEGTSGAFDPSSRSTGLL